MTWTRKELKTKAKAAFKRNIVATIVVAFILALVSGAFSGSSSSDSSSNDDGVYYDYGNYDSGDYSILDENGNVVGTIGSTVGSLTGFGILGTITSLIATFMTSGLVILITLIALAVGIVIDAFVCNPIAVGCSKFFRDNETAPASLDDIIYVFKCGSYMNVVKIMLVRDLKLLGWTLLLIIPGFVKGYEYMMIPYLLAENPDMDMHTAFESTREIMDGQKMDAFVLSLSFILWDIVGSLLWSIPAILFVNPYKYQTQAELYLTLTGQDSQYEQGTEYEQY